MAFCERVEILEWVKDATALPSFLVNGECLLILSCLIVIPCIIKQNLNQLPCLHIFSLLTKEIIIYLLFNSFQHYLSCLRLFRFSPCFPSISDINKVIHKVSVLMIPMGNQFSCVVKDCWQQNCISFYLRKHIWFRILPL